MRKLSYGRRINAGAEEATVLWLSDRENDATQLDPKVIWLRYDEALHRRLWKKFRNLVLEEWIAKAPGTRPTAWWTYDAPRQPRGTFADCYYDGKLPEPRKKLSGTGIPAWECYNLVPDYDHGAPTCWSGVELSDLPCFESEAAFLKRHGLLSSAEKRKLHRSDFETATRIEYDPDDYPDRPWREVARERILARVASREEAAERATTLLAGLQG